MNLSDMTKEIDDCYNRDNVDNTMRSVYTKGFRSGVKWYSAALSGTQPTTTNKASAELLILLKTARSAVGNDIEVLCDNLDIAIAQLRT